MALPMLALAALPSLFKAGTALFQGAEARRLSRTPRPEYKRPDEANELLAMAKGDASQKEAPGSSCYESVLARM